MATIREVGVNALQPSNAAAPTGRSPLHASVSSRAPTAAFGDARGGRSRPGRTGCRSGAPRRSRDASADQPNEPSRRRRGRRRTAGVRQSDIAQMPARPARRSADAAADVRNTVEGRGQKLIVAIEPEPVWVDGDSQRLPHVFDLFSQARPLEGIGLGIGLNVVREIVLLHGGSIEARRDGAWKGSEFIVRLPFAERRA